MTYVEISSLIVILTTMLKTGYDLKLSGYLYDRDKGVGKTTTEAVKAKKCRDKISTIMVFGIVISASILSLRDSVMTDSVSREEFDSLAKRVQKLESPLLAEVVGPSGGPDGGGPTQLADILDDLYKKLNEVQNNFVTKNEFDEIVREIAQLKSTLGVAFVPQPVTGAFGQIAIGGKEIEAGE